MKKKILSLFMAMLMAVLILPVQAFAEEYVYLSISDDAEFVRGVKDDSVVIAYLAVPISELQKIDLDDYYLGDYKYDINGDGEINKYDVSVLHLYVYAHLKYYDADFINMTGEDGNPVFTAGGSPGSLFMTRFWGHDCNLIYYKNGEYPIDEEMSAANNYLTGATADRISAEANDFIKVTMYTSWDFYNDSAAAQHYFLDNAENKKIVHKYTLDEGETFEGTYGKAFAGMGENGEGGAYSTIHDVEEITTTVYYSKNGIYDPAAQSVETNGGKFSISGLTAGTWHIWTDGGYGNEYPESIVSSPAYAKIVVEGSFVRGDVNGDGVINTQDATLALRIAINIAVEGANPEAADYNGDGTVNTQDATLILRRAINVEIN